MRWTRSASTWPTCWKASRAEPPASSVDPLGAGDQRHEAIDADVAPPDSVTPTRWPRKRSRCCISAAGAQAPEMQHELQTFEDRSASPHHHRVGHGEHVADQGLDHFEGMPSWRLRLLPVADGARHIDVERACRCAATAACRCRAPVRRRTPRCRGNGVWRPRTSRQETATAGADDQCIERPGILDQLQRRRALAGHHRQVVVERDQLEKRRVRASAARRSRRGLPCSGRRRSPRRRSRAWQRA